MRSPSVWRINITEFVHPVIGCRNKYAPGHEASDAYQSECDLYPAFPVKTRMTWVDIRKEWSTKTYLSCGKSVVGIVDTSDLRAGESGSLKSSSTRVVLPSAILSTQLWCGSFRRTVSQRDAHSLNVFVEKFTAPQQVGAAHVLQQKALVWHFVILCFSHWMNEWKNVNKHKSIIRRLTSQYFRVSPSYFGFRSQE